MAQALPGRTLGELHNLQQALVAARRADRAAEGTTERSQVMEARRDLVAAELDAARRDMARAVGSQTPYRERLVRFWANHFTVMAPGLAYRATVSVHVDEAIRPHVTGQFAAMLRAAILHPAMLRFLNQPQSVGPDSAFGEMRGRGLNENLARELLELHTLGSDGPYGQEDVRQLAKLLTGLGIDNGVATAFHPNRAQRGSEIVLGRRYGGDRRARIEDIHLVLDDLAAHPATAAHIARKLAVHFVSDAPGNALVSDLTDVFLRTQGDLKAVSIALAQHPEAQDRILHKARQPFDFLAAALRALDVETRHIMALNPRQTRMLLLGPMQAMGQPWQAPGGPDGWDEWLDVWISPQGLAARIDWAMDAPGRLVNPLPDARAFVDMALNGVADEGLRRIVAAAENNAEGVGLVLASPAFNRR